MFALAAKLEELHAGALLLHAAQVIDEDLAVEVIEFVLHANGKKAVRIELEGVPVEILGAHFHGGRTLDVFVESLERETSLFVIDEFLA